MFDQSKEQFFLSVSKEQIDKPNKEIWENTSKKYIKENLTWFKLKKR